MHPRTHPAHPSTHLLPPPPHTLEQVLMVVERPERAQGESAADYGARLQNERVLALNPNYEQQ